MEILRGGEAGPTVIDELRILRHVASQRAIDDFLGLFAPEPIRAVGEEVSAVAGNGGVDMHAAEIALGCVGQIVILGHGLGSRFFELRVVRVAEVAPGDVAGVADGILAHQPIVAVNHAGEVIGHVFVERAGLVLVAEGGGVVDDAMGEFVGRDVEGGGQHAGSGRLFAVAEHHEVQVGIEEGVILVELTGRVLEAGVDQGRKIDAPAIERGAVMGVLVVMEAAGEVRHDADRGGIPLVDIGGAGIADALFERLVHILILHIEDTDGAEEIRIARWLRTGGVIHRQRGVNRQILRALLPAMHLERVPQEIVRLPGGGRGIDGGQATQNPAVRGGDDHLPGGDGGGNQRDRKGRNGTDIR